MTLLAVGIAVLALALSGNTFAQARAIARRVKALSSTKSTSTPEPYDDSEVRATLEVVADMTEALRADYAGWQADINLAVAEGIKHVERAENRIKATIRRAREELEEGGVRSPGLEAEALELFGPNGEGGGGGRMSAVPTHMDGHHDDFSAFPGAWLPEHLAALRG